MTSDETYALSIIRVMGGQSSAKEAMKDERLMRGALTLCRKHGVPVPPQHMQQESNG